jgi:hypothetical protein
MGKQLVNFITCSCESSAPFFVIYKAGHEPTPFYSSTITGLQDIAKILLKMALKHHKTKKSKSYDLKVFGSKYTKYICTREKNLSFIKDYIIKEL